MANWSDLKAAIAQVIKTNGTQAITGQILQDSLNNIISNVGKDCTFAGIATPTTNPGVPDGNVFYLATEPGTYVNFNGIEIASGETVILEWRGSWTKKTTGFAAEAKLTELEKIPLFLENTKLNCYVKELYIKGLNKGEEYCLNSLRENAQKTHYQLILGNTNGDILLSFNFNKKEMGISHDFNDDIEGWAFLQREEGIVGNLIYQNSDLQKGKVNKQVCGNLNYSPSIFAYLNRNDYNLHKESKYLYVYNDIDSIASRYIQELYIEGLEDEVEYCIQGLFISSDGTNRQLVIGTQDDDGTYFISFVVKDNGKNIAYSSREDYNRRGYCIFKNLEEINSTIIWHNYDVSKYTINKQVCGNLNYSPSIFAYLNRNDYNLHKESKYLYVYNDIDSIASRYIQELYIEGLEDEVEYCIQGLFISSDGTNRQLVIGTQDDDGTYFISFVVKDNGKNIAYSSREDYNRRGYCIFKNLEEINSTIIWHNYDVSKYTINKQVCGNLNYSPSITEYLNNPQYVLNTYYSRYIKELYIEGLEENKEYCIQSLRQNNSGTHNQIIIGTDEEGYTLSFNIEKGYTGVKYVESNNIKGYCVLDNRYEINGNLIYLNFNTKIATINKNVSCDISYSPIILSYKNLLSKQPKIWMPKKIFALKGTDLYVFRCSISPTRNPENYDLHITGVFNNNQNAYGYNRNYYWVYPVGDITDFELVFGLKNEYGTFSSNNSTRIIHVNKPSSPTTNKNILVIGDSFTDQKYWVSELRRIITGTTDEYSDISSSKIKSDNLNNITFIGTQDTEYTPNEGYSGMHYAFFSGDGSNFGKVNPFWNTSEGKIDFSYYCNKNSFGKIDYAIILLGTNGYNEDKYVNAVWDALLEHNPEIKVIIMSRAFANPWCAGVQGLRFQQEYIQFSETAAEINEYYQEHCELEKYKNNFLYIDYNTQMDVWNNYHYEERDANARNSSVKFRNSSDPNDNIHPGKLAYWQIAEAVRPAFYYFCLNSNTL